jgi:ABC-type sugar transport system ATPase subunit
MTATRLQPTATEAPCLRAVGIFKAFGHVQALRGASVDVREGHVKALVGDNGAGKSTLVKILSGLYQPDEGTIELDGEAIQLESPSDAIRRGIATVFQDLALVEVLDVATNMYLGRIPTRRGMVDDRRMHEDAADNLQALRIRVPSVRVPVGHLSGGQRQAVAVARAVTQGSRIIIMDEPTAALGVRESRQVLDVVRELRAQGRAVIIISHDLETVFNVSDSITVLRLGRVAGARKTSETSREEIVRLITGAISDEQVAS